MKQLVINGKRLFQHLTELGQIGRTNQGGITRLALTPEDLQARKLVKKYMQNAGLTVREDQAGNIIGLLEGSEKNAPAIITGSHIDTVLNGGAFDGALGVLGGIEALQTMQEQNITPKHPLEVIVFTDEEGTRFNLNFIGSRACAGCFAEEFLQYRDANNIYLKDAMLQAGFSPEKIMSAKRSNLKYFLELHIEQAKVLEEYEVPLGIVTGIAGPLWLKFTVKGEAGHAGATPMNLRQDPLPAALKLIEFLFAQAQENPGVVVTVGKMELLPGGINIIPAQVEFTLDLRDIEEKTINLIQKNIETYLSMHNQKEKVQIQMQVMQKVQPVKCSVEIIAKIKQAVQELNLKPFELMSGAGHDSMNFKNLCPIGMIFVRSKGGLSHHPKEWSSPEDCALGVEVLYQTLLKLDQS